MKKISTLICLLIMVCISGGMAYAQDTTSPFEADTPVVGTHVSGEILSDTTWNLAGSPYIVTGDITVRHSSISWGTSIATLTIESGVEVRFEPGTGLYVGLSYRTDDYGYYGALSVAGAAEAPVVFTSNASNPLPGDWKGIAFRKTTIDEQTSLEHATVEYGGDTGSNSGNIYCENANPTIKDSTIQHSSGAGLYLVSSSPTLEDNIISDNGHDGIYSDDKSGAVISKNTINNNGGDAVNIHPMGVKNIRSNQGSGNGNNAIAIRGGNITSSSKWVSLDQGALPYVVTGDIVIRHSSISWGTSTATLTIRPGAEIRFERGTGLYVGLSYRSDGYGYYGALSVVGAAEAPVVFTSNASNPSPGDWKGIVFRKTTNDVQTSLEHTTVEYGGDTGSDSGNIYCDSADPTIRNSTIRHSSGSGLYLVSSSPAIEDNIISDNGQDGISSDDKSGAVISANTISNNVGAAVNIHPQSVVNIRDNQGSGNGQNAVAIRGGDLTSNSTWVSSYQGTLPYIVTGDITIRHSKISWGTSTATLTIEPGVEIRFEPGTGLYVGVSNRTDDYGYYGALAVAGTEENPVVFTSNATNPSPGNWQGIVFRRTTDDGQTSLEYSIVEYGGDTGSDSGNIYCDNANITLKYSTIRHSSGSGLYLVSSSPTLENNIISDNGQDGIFSDDKSVPHLSGNTINNSAGVAVNIHPQSVENIRDNQGSGNGQNAIAIKGGDITSNITWVSLDQGALPYVVTGDITVRHSSISWGTSTATLRIEPGVKILFEPGTGLYVGFSNRTDDYGYWGALSAVGTVGMPIVFTSNAATVSPGDWKGLRFQNQTQDSEPYLEHCVIEYGGQTDNANIYLANAKPTIQYNTIRNSSHSGIYVNGTGANGAAIRCNNLKDNHYGVTVVNNAAPVINSNNFLCNKNLGVSNTGSIDVDATNNWWNDANGPGVNGDDVSGNLHVAPWLLEESSCITSPPTNTAPFLPKDPVPANGAVRVPVVAEGQPIDVSLGWAGGDPNPWDTVVYDVYFGSAEDSLVSMAESIETTSYAKADLAAGTTYYWKIVARDDAGGETAGPVWQFTTLGDPPDLIVSDLSWQPAADLQAGQTITFTATVENTGSGPVVDGFQVELYVDGSRIGSTTVDPVMAPATSLPLSFS